MHIRESEQEFIYHFGEMGSRWGISRTVGQIYALLVISAEPLYADQIAEVLSISRGNVSMGVKELQSWGLIHVHHKPGDRKDYYSSLKDVWEMARVIFEERRKREIEPTLSRLRGILIENNFRDASSQERYAMERMGEVLELLELVTQWSVDLQRIHPDSLRSLMKMGSGIIKLLEIKDKRKIASGKTPPDALSE